jgi:ABC-2 type transport system permease protein
VQATYLYGSASFDAVDYLAPVYIGLFVFLFVFILTSVAFLRERSAGTLERLQATPIRRHEIILGYMLGFSAFALLQSLLILGFAILILKVHYTGNLLVVFVVEILLAMMAVNMGIFFSTFARNEFQIVQFIPLVLVTQIALSGMLWAVEDMPAWLQPIAWLMPLTHANRALRDVMIKGFDLGQIMPFVLALIGFAAAFVVLAAQTVRRQGAH